MHYTLDANRPGSDTFDRFLHKINRIKDTKFLEPLCELLCQTKYIIDACNTLNSIQVDNLKCIPEFYLLAVYLMEREKSMQVLSKDNNILPPRKPSVPWMKQCLYGDVTDNWLSVLKNPNDNMDIVEYKILEWFESHDLRKIFVILQNKFSKLRRIFNLIFRHGSQNAKLLCHDIENFLDTMGIAFEMDKTINEFTTNQMSDAVSYHSEKMKNTTQMIEQILKLPVFQKINQTYEEEPLLMMEGGFPQYEYIVQQLYPQERDDSIRDFNKGVHGIWKHKSIDFFITWTVRKVESVSVESFNAYEQRLKNHDNEKDISAASYSLSKTMTDELSGVESASASCTDATGQNILLNLSFDDIGELEDTVTFLSIHPHSLSHNEFVIMTFVDIHYARRERSYIANLVNNIHKWQEQNPLVFDESEIYSEGGESLSDDGTYLAENTGLPLPSRDESESFTTDYGSGNFFDAPNRSLGSEATEVGDSASEGMHELSAGTTPLPSRYVSDESGYSSEAEEHNRVAVRTLEGDIADFIARRAKADVDGYTAKPLEESETTRTLEGDLADFIARSAKADVDGYTAKPLEESETTPNEKDTNAPKGTTERTKRKNNRKKKK